MSCILSAVGVKRVCWLKVWRHFPQGTVQSSPEDTRDGISESPVSMCYSFKSATDLNSCHFPSKGKPTLPTITKIKTCARETQIKSYLECKYGLPYKSQQSLSHECASADLVPLCGACCHAAWPPPVEPLSTPCRAGKEHFPAAFLHIFT